MKLNHLIVCLVPSVSGGGPSSVSVSEETAVSLTVSWVPPNAHVLQYRVTYTALTGAEGQDNTVSELELGWMVNCKLQTANVQKVVSSSYGFRNCEIVPALYKHLFTDNLFS